MIFGHSKRNGQSETEKKKDYIPKEDVWVGTNLAKQKMKPDSRIVQSSVSCKNLTETTSALIRVDRFTYCPVHTPLWYFEEE